MFGDFGINVALVLIALTFLLCAAVIGHAIWRDR
jgi:hypothetical protein